MSSENQLRNKGIEDAVPPSRNTAILNAFSHLNKMHFFIGLYVILNLP